MTAALQRHKQSSALRGHAASCLRKHAPDCDCRVTMSSKLLGAVIAAAMVQFPIGRRLCPHSRIALSNISGSLAQHLLLASMQHRQWDHVGCITHGPTQGIHVWAQALLMSAGFVAWAASGFLLYCLRPENVGLYVHQRWMRGSMGACCWSCTLGTASGP